jgi:hypothetical protein
VFTGRFRAFCESGKFEMDTTQTLYEIIVEGQLDRHYWAAWFDGLAVTPQADGNTRLAGPVADQSALHGVLDKVRDLGLTLVAVQRVTQKTEGEQKGLLC